MSERVLTWLIRAWSSVYSRPSQGEWRCNDIIPTCLLLSLSLSLSLSAHSFRRSNLSEWEFVSAWIQRLREEDRDPCVSQPHSYIYYCLPSQPPPSHPSTSTIMNLSKKSAMPTSSPVAAKPSSLELQPLPKAVPSMTAVLTFGNLSLTISAARLVDSWQNSLHAWFWLILVLWGT